MIYLISHKSVCRTVPATLGLLNITPVIQGEKKLLVPLEKFVGDVCIGFTQKYVRLGLFADVFKTKIHLEDIFTLALMNK